MLRTYAREGLILAIIVAAFAAFWIATPGDSSCVEVCEISDE